MTSALFSLIFLLFLLMSLLFRMTLNIRQITAIQEHRDTLPQLFAGIIPLQSHQRAADYNRAKLRLNLVGYAVGALLALGLTLCGGLQWLYETLAQVSAPHGLPHGLLLLAALIVIQMLIDLPFSIYSTFVIEKKFGFNHMTPGLFVTDILHVAVLGCTIGLPVLAAVLWLTQAMGALWWLWVWLFWLGFNLAAQLIWPNFIAPLFNQFTPLPDGDLKTRIETLLQRCGFHCSNLFVMDGSRRSSHGNAYFTGFGTSKRIVLFNTLLNKLNPEEIEAVLAHELGHFHYHHIWKRLLAIAALALGILWLCSWLFRQDWFYYGLGMRQQDLASALALLMLTLPFFLFPVSPVMNRWSRMHEFQADAYAATQARASDLTGALIKLYRDNASTLTPDPLYSSCFDSHPPAVLRISKLQATH